jgi:transcriptional regulator with XRE-family HTH domain
VSQNSWRKRLQEAADNSGKSLRSISLAAGCSPGYLHGILSSKKEPTIARLVNLCRVLGVSVAYVILGTADTKAAARAASKFADATLAAREALTNYEHLQQEQ